MGWFITFTAWQIAVLPHIIATSFGTGMTILGVLFFWKAFWPEHWKEFWEDEYPTG